MQNGGIMKLWDNCLNCDLNDEVMHYDEIHYHNAFYHLPGIPG